ncbi:hypothetical protein KM043_016953 [Ampulex compressa]|nr:hypothetical protein KM043_016953 [Ampulex compressa]
MKDFQQAFATILMLESYYMDYGSTTKIRKEYTTSNPVDGKTVRKASITTLPGRRIGSNQRTLTTLTRLLDHQFPVESVFVLRRTDVRFIGRAVNRKHGTKHPGIVKFHFPGDLDSHQKCHRPNKAVMEYIGRFRAWHRDGA